MPETEFRHAEKPEIGYHHFPVFQEYVFRLQVFVDNALGVQISHALDSTKQTM